MSAFGRVLGSRRVAYLAAGMLSFGLFALHQPVHAAAPTYPDTLPLSQVKVGMKGYGLTTFKGTTISRFEVTVLGILRKANNGRDLILIKMKGGPITERAANLIHGMSGSPIYLNGKVAGAFSQGEPFPKEAMGMVTPIGDMLEAWDPDIPQHPTYYEPATPNAPQSAEKSQKVGARWQSDNRQRVVSLPSPITLGDRHISQLVLNARPGGPLHSTNERAVLERATSMVSVTGISEASRVWLQKEFDKRGYTVTVMRGGAAGRDPSFKGAPLRPGSAFGTFLAVGDVQVGATGTVTYRRGNRILGFGHPLFGLGPMEAAVTSAQILDIFAGYETSHHIAVPGPVIGTLRQDRDFSVSADLGQKPHLIPFDVTVNDKTLNRSKTFHSSLFLHPDLTPVLLRLVAQEAVSRVHDLPGDSMAKVTTTVEAAEVGSITRTNTVFDSDSIAGLAAQDLNEITGIVSGNPFYPLPIQRAQLTVDITSGHNTAAVERIFLKQGRHEPGDMMDIGVVLKPYRREPVLRTLSVKIPSDTPTGRYQLIVRGGMPNIIRFGSFTFLGGGSQDAQSPAVNVRQMIARFKEKEVNTDLVARLIFNSLAPSLEGERLSQLPPNLSALMRSERNSGVRLEREDVKATAPTEYVVSGTQQLYVTVVRKNTQEPSAGPNFGGLPSLGGGGGAPGLSLGGGPSGLNASDEAAPSSEPTEGEAAEGGARPSNLLETPPLTFSGEAARWMAALNASEPPKPAPDNKKKDEKKKDDKKGKPEKPGASDKTPDTTTAPPPSSPPPSAPESTNEKPIGRQLQVWRQTARADFHPGKFTATSVSAEGELRLTSRLNRHATTTETYIWSLVADGKGNLYAGTGTSGKILKIDADGKISTFAALPVISVQSLLMGKDGTLYAGSGVKGQLYRIAPNGTFTLMGALPQKYILALAQDSKGNLYVGPGGGGTVYKVDNAQRPTPNAPTPYLQTSADHIMSLATDAQDNLYVGTGNEGIIYKVTPDGKSSVLYDAKENSVTALAADDKGNVYAATGPKGILYRINSDGVATTLFDRASSFFTGLKIAPDGSLYATTVNAVFHLTASADNAAQMTVLPLDNPKDVDFLTLAVGERNVYVGTGNVGEIYTAALGAEKNGARSGVFESVVHDARLVSRWGMIRWNAQVPAGSRLRVETRTGNAAEPDTTWSSWSVASVSSSSPSEAKITSPAARFIQYRLTLEADSSQAQPTVREVALSYMPRNQAPKVTFQAPLGGERWAKSQTVRWNGDDPDRDTLTYELYYSTDAGATWKPLPGEAKTGESKPATTSATPEPGKTQSVAELEQKLDTDPTMPPALRQMILDSARRRAQAGSGGSGGGLRDNSKSWDTKSLPDGVYWLKVVASDRASNPVDPQTGQAISEPFLICNATPRITLTARQVMATDKTLAIEGSVSQALIAITAVQYRVDGGDWVSAVPKDGLFDSANEGFGIVTTPLTSGKHTLEIKAFNAAGNTTTEKIEVTVS